jgi:hypothetical protein
MAQELEELRALVQKQEPAAQGKTAAKSAGAKHKVDAAATGETPGAKKYRRGDGAARRGRAERGKSGAGSRQRRLWAFVGAVALLGAVLGLFGEV